MSKPEIVIKTADVGTIARLSAAIPEFDQPYPESEFRQRLSSAPQLLLVAFIDNQPAGFKAGYALSATVFYSWMGGVLPQYRRMGVAEALANAQEEWARQNGYATIELKTRNRHKPMLCFALCRGFDIFGIEMKDSIQDVRIFLRKTLAS